MILEISIDVQEENRDSFIKNIEGNFLYLDEILT